MADEKKGAKKGGGEAQAKAPKPEKADRRKGDGEKGKGGGKKAKGAEGRGAPASMSAPPSASSTESVSPRLLDKYKGEVVPALTKQFNYKNPMQVPRLQKIVVNMGLGAAVANPKIIDTAVEELKAVSGQKPVVTRAKKAIANFKLRAGIPIGAMVTLRSARMWEFLDRLVSVALPRTRDFKGVSRKAFDGKGNYTLGLREQIIFPEINYDKIDAVKGLNISFVTSARTDEEGRALLQRLGMPFRAS
ncbi:MAG: 50S ribosomal protein L5 [Myxococcales bacterium]|nr:50S ribosomal protein L5 [Myxococcales bacterium]